MTFGSYFRPRRAARDEEEETEKNSIGLRALPEDERPTSLYPEGDFRNSKHSVYGGSSIREVKSHVMVNWLHQQQLEKMWSQGGSGEGVVLRMAKKSYSCAPESLGIEDTPFYRNVSLMNVKVSSRPPRSTELVI